MPELTPERLQQIRRELEFPTLSFEDWEKVEELLAYIEEHRSSKAYNAIL